MGKNNKALKNTKFENYNSEFIRDKENNKFMDTTKEYIMLREEVMHMYKIIEDLRKVLYVAVASILTFAITQNEPLVCLVPYCVIFPAYFGTISHEYGMLKIGAYMMVFLEGNEFNWESRVYEFSKSATNSIKDVTTSYMPYIATAIACTALFVIKMSLLNISYGFFVRVFFAITCLIGLLLCILNKDDTLKKREAYKEKWTEIKEREG